MTRVVDLWRWLEPTARLVSGSVDRLGQPVRGVRRTRAAPPHLPDHGDGHLLVVDAAILGAGGLDELLEGIEAAALDPAAVWVAGPPALPLDAASSRLPVFAGERSGSDTDRVASAHLEREEEELAGVASVLRLVAAEAALADPRPAAPAGAVAARLHRGVAVTIDGSLVSLNPREAGRALATRFAAIHDRLLAGRSATPSEARRSRDGLWILERPIAPGSAAWLFDDAPVARIDAVGLDALTAVLRALHRRGPDPRAAGVAGRRQPPSTGNPLRDTLLAVARANGRIAPAARSLGVHRNTVLYRLRRASRDLGIDPRRPEDALRLLRTEDSG